MASIKSYCIEYLSKLLNIDKYKCLLNKEYAKYNPELFIDFTIIKHNNKIYCLSPFGELIDIKMFHFSQLSLMKIYYKSFNPDIINDIDIFKPIIDEIYINIDQDIYYKQTNEYLLTDNIKLSKCEDKYTYCIRNIQKYLSNIKKSICINENIKEIRNMYTFIYNNYYYIKDKDNFIKTVIDKMYEIDDNIKQYKDGDEELINNSHKCILSFIRLGYLLYVNDVIEYDNFIELLKIDV
jgi:hypothetical protein